MTSALSHHVPPPDGWSTEDLDAMPEDGRRRELLDGVLIMPPSPTVAHQTITMRLAAALADGCPDGYDVTHGVEIRFDQHRALIPDVLVTTFEAAKRQPHWYHPHEVVLAVEVVSPGTRVMDRITKPAIYAQAGIPFHWRIETHEALVAYTHQLDSVTEEYVPTGRWTKVIEVPEPWLITLPLARITPRYL
ncbi:Uma2 family endonuclease [Solwaraspora sp. WMMD1047]|uniref:Uma2 family endonuclease n=1 Tax=Solwaraspora sp. WMMD1047 TaxID=3016102 RepID=UPI002416EC42|nr:Uma2 family endonuclease [Solwaraspora sp. WMMD1047]MDG4828381.1 Uma2 family endonuclease [Solwaraspora sp. WMMD1047]